MPKASWSGRPASPGIFDITAPIAAMITGYTLGDTFDITGAVSPAQL